MEPEKLTADDIRLRLLLTGYKTSVQQAEKALALAQLMVEQASRLGERETSGAETATGFLRERR
ncbi:MAG: hypothetical protein O2854_05710 [Chloroflexi bacterium]|nr:hypothetical protein [Chloroflexota bacterium]